ncbi:MAG: hypothetical protein NVSMB27_14770 [Ktedonobacteraceae bacterium]
MIHNNLTYRQKVTRATMGVTRATTRVQGSRTLPHTTPAPTDTKGVNHNA